MNLVQRRLLAGSCCLLVTLSIAGCGGGGGGGSIISTPGTGNYAASYVGDYQNVTTGDRGTLSFTVNSLGALTGVLVNGKALSGTLTGEVTANGTTSGTITLAITGGVTDTGTGTLGPAGATTLYGSLIDAANNQIFITAVVNPPAAASGFSFAGDYSGTLTNVTKTLTGIVSLTVAPPVSGSPTGVLSGSVVSDDGATPVIATITGTVGASGAVAYSVNAASGSGITSVTGSAVITGGALTGTFVNTEAPNQTLQLDAPSVP